MERRLRKPSFVGIFSRVVTPFQNVFHKRYSRANLSTGVLQFFSGLQNEMIREMINGACALSRHRGSDNVTAEDLLCYLDTRWKVDPLLVSENYCRVEETTKEIDRSRPTEPLPKQRRMNRCSDTKKSTVKVRKLSARQLKKMEEIEAERRTLAICRWFLYKLPFPELKKKEPELKVELKEEEQAPDDIMSRPDIIEFFGKKHRQFSFNSVPKPAPVASTDKSNSMVEKKSSVLDHTIKVHPSKGRTGLGSKIQKHDQQSLTIKMQEAKQDLVDSMSKQTPETFTHKQKSKIHEKISTSDISIKKFQIKEKMELESEEPLIKMSSFQEKLLVTLPASKDKQEVSSVLKLPSETPMCKLKSKAEEKTSTCDQSIKPFPFTKKTENDLKVVKHLRIQTHASQAPDQKWKQKVPCVNNHASVKTTVIEGQPSIEIPAIDLKVPKVSGKKRKRERFDNNAVPGETPEAARKRLALVLLRIAGKFSKVC